MTDFERKLHEWRDAEDAASAAEAALQALGQGAQDPRVAELHRRARELRAKADAMLAQALQMSNKPQDR